MPAKHSISAPHVSLPLVTSTRCERCRNLADILVSSVPFFVLQMLAKHSISAHMSFCLGDGILVDDPKENGFLVLGSVKIPGLSTRTHYDIK